MIRSLRACCVPLLLLCQSCGGSTQEPPAAPESGALDGADSAAGATNGTPSPKEETKPWIQGSRLRLWLPEGVDRLGRAYIYRNKDSTLVVALAELTAAESEGEQLVEGIIKGAGELSVLSDETNGTERRLLLSGKKTDREARMLVLENGGKAATIYLLASPGRLADVDKILESASLNPAAPLNSLEIHGLSLGDLGTLSLSDTAHQPVLLTRKDQKPPIPATSVISFVSVHPHNHGSAITDEQLGGFIGANISNLSPNFDSAKVNEIQISGRKAQELVLQGEKDETPLAIYTYALADGDTVVVAVAYVQLDHADQELSDVVPLLRSLKLNSL